MVQLSKKLPLLRSVAGHHFGGEPLGPVRLQFLTLDSYNFDNNVNLGQAKLNDLSLLFKEKTDMGAQDVEASILSAHWSSMPEKKRKNLLDQLYD